jgi:hypothetical protein
MLSLSVLKMDSSVLPLLSGSSHGDDAGGAQGEGGLVAGET